MEQPKAYRATNYNHRRKNKSDMTIPEQIEAIKESVCDGYCKFRAEAAGVDPDYFIEKFCSGCPLTQL